MTTIMTESAKKFETESSIWWSPDLHFAHLGVKYWRLKITQKQVDVNMNKQLKGIISELPSEFDLSYGDNTKTLFGYLRSAKKYLQRCKRNSKKLRKDFHKKKIIESLETNDNKLHGRVKAILYAEETSKMY